MKVYIRQSHLVCFFRIFKAYAVKINGTVFHLIHRVFRIAESAFFIQHFHDSSGRLAGHGDHNKHHGKHHQAAEDLEIIGKKRGELSHIQIKPFRSNDGIGSEIKHKDHNGIQTELHQGVVKGQDLLRLCKVHTYILCRRGKFLLFEIFADIGFHHAHTFDILLNGSVQPVVLAEHFFKQRHGASDHQPQAHSQNRDHKQEDHRHLTAHDKRHDKGEYQHQRTADSDTHDHHVCHLHIGNICRQPGHKG